MKSNYLDTIWMLVYAIIRVERMDTVTGGTHVKLY